MPSITTWTRIEPKSRNKSMESSLEARIHDPLWLLARQWQFGEFQGEDNGSPVQAVIESEVNMLSRYFPGQPLLGSTNSGEQYSNDIPLQVLVECEPITEQNSWDHRLSAELGMNFFRVLGEQLTNKYKAIFLASYPLTDPNNQEPSQLDYQSQRFTNVLAGRVISGWKLYRSLISHRMPNGRVTLPGEAPFDSLDANDKPIFIKAVEDWIRSCDEIYRQPKTTSAWASERMEHEFAISASMSASKTFPKGEIVGVASEYSGGRLDWYSFDIDCNTNLGAGSKLTQSPPRKVTPTPVQFPGMPNNRWWEFEDSKINFGSVLSDPEDLAKLLLIEFALIYGNDFFMIPIDLPIGSVCRIASLKITNTFGETTLIPPISQLDGNEGNWQMFRLSMKQAGINTDEWPDILFLPPVIASSLESQPMEKVVMIRDEMANIAWAIEDTIVSSSGSPLKRLEVYLRNNQKNKQTDSEASSEDTASLPPLPQYKLVSKVPDFWFPLIPITLPSKRLVLQRFNVNSSIDNYSNVPKGLILEPSRTLTLNEEEVPRSGIVVTRKYHYTRWIDGSVHLWMGKSKKPGRGEGSSGLRFDYLQTQDSQ